MRKMKDKLMVWKKTMFCHKGHLEQEILVKRCSYDTPLFGKSLVAMLMGYLSMLTYNWIVL